MPTCRRSKLQPVAREAGSQVQGGAGMREAKAQDDVVDADFKEVKDSK
jgi:hypothetical protein